MEHAEEAPVSWSRVERVRSEGKTRYLMLVSETSVFLYGYLLVKTADGDLDFQTVPGEDATSRRTWLVEKAMVDRRTPLRQDPETGEWKPRD